MTPRGEGDLGAQAREMEESLWPILNEPTPTGTDAWSFAVARRERLRELFRRALAEAVEAEREAIKGRLCESCKQAM